MAFRMSGVRASFGGMLLLIAIHFHSNQMTAINDLVSSTLGMKVCAPYITATCVFVQRLLMLLCYKPVYLSYLNLDIFLNYFTRCIILRPKNLL